MTVLAIGCHPDDLEIGCGGTLALYVKQGHTVVMCHIANGDMGHKIINSHELKDIRAKEAENAANIIGAKEVISLDVSDLTVDSYNQEIVKKLVDVIRYTKPDVIITHSTEDYMKDHLEVSKLVFDASFSSSIPNYKTENEAYENIVPIYYMDTLAGVNFLPTEYVDISDTIDIKLQSIDSHQSQIKWFKDHDGIDFLEFVSTVSKFRGLQCGVRFAEGFRLCNTWPRVVAKRLLP